MAVTLPSVHVMPSQPEHGSVVGSQLVSTVPFVSMLACHQQVYMVGGHAKRREGRCSRSRAQVGCGFNRGLAP